MSQLMVLALQLFLSVNNLLRGISAIVKQIMYADFNTSSRLGAEVGFLDITLSSLPCRSLW